MKSFFTTPAYTVPAPAHVPVAWLDALPRGSNFAAPAIAGIDDGQDVTGPDREPAPIGQIYTENDGSKSRFVLLATDKVARISATQAALVEDFNGQQTQPSTPRPRSPATCPAPFRSTACQRTCRRSRP